MMTNGDPYGNSFYATLTQVMDSFPCSPLTVYFKQASRSQVPENAEMQNNVMMSL